jgi:phage protein D
LDARRADTTHVLKGIDRDTGLPLEPLVFAPESPLVIDDPFLEENLNSIEDADKRDRLKLFINSAHLADAEMVLLRDTHTVVEHSVATLTTAEELRLRRDNWFDLSKYGMDATGSCVGVPELRARRMVRVDDVGGKFSGTWYVNRVQHTFDGKGFRTDFGCMR